MKITHDRVAVCVDFKWSVAPIVVGRPAAEFLRPSQAYLIPRHVAAPWVEMAHVTAAERVLASGLLTGDKAVTFELDASVEGTNLLVLVAKPAPQP